MEWTATIETSHDVDDDLAAGIAMHLPHAAVGTGRGRTSVTFSIDAPEIDKATTVALDAAQDLWAGAIDSLQVVEAALFAEQVNTPDVPDLVGVSEAADMLGVARQRVSELDRSGRLPDPIVRLKSGPVWDRRVLVQFESGWERKPGRPPR